QWHPVYRFPSRITAPSGLTGVDEVTDFTYDGQGNLLQKTITAGTKVRQWSYTYNAYGQVLRVDGPRTDVSDTTDYSYYGASDPCLYCRGNVKTVTNALGHVTTYSNYDADGHARQVTDANGVATTFAYDTLGRPLSSTTDA